MCSREASECAYAGHEFVEFEDGVRTAVAGAEVVQRSNLSSSQRQHVLSTVEPPSVMRNTCAHRRSGSRGSAACLHRALQKEIPSFE